MKFELRPKEVGGIALLCLTGIAGVLFADRFLMGCGIGGLTTALLVIFFTARR